MVAISRRVSYIIPAPTEPPGYLTLPPLDQPRRGHPQPFFLPKGVSSGANGEALGTRNPFFSPSPDLSPGESPNGTGHHAQSHPRHCLGVTSLALDTSTVLTDASSPGGILYSGGRDGLVCSWELNVPHKRRRGGRYEIQPGRGQRTKWEKVGDGAEFFEEDEEDEEEGEHEDDEFGDRDSSDEEDAPGRGEVPYEERWEVDKEAIASKPPAETKYRQSAQTHTDWVNAVVLCNLNQTVITASSDRTIRAWSPHAASDEQGLSPSLIGTHRDYVRALAWAKYPGLLFSGSLDRRLNLWDVQSGTPDAPVMSINMDVIEDYGGVGLEGERGSVYALGVDHTGGILAAGTPERVIRLWDPRSGERSVGKLIGHSDCVRSILVSEDGRYMLTGSSDTTVKLWSLAAHRCIHTFNHHTSSVWSLFSNHPNLERFYSGSRDGHLCAVDVEQVTEMSDGECVVLSRDSASAAPVMRDGEQGYESKSGDEGIRAIVGMDDEYVWTANGSADIKRWRDVGRRIHRSAPKFDGASYGDAGALGQPFAQQPTAPIVPQVPEGIRNKRLSVDGGVPLDRVESNSRSVAFAPEPVRNGEMGSPGAGSPGGLTASPSRDRLGVPQARKTTLSGAPVAGSIATSFMSEISSLHDDPAHANESTLNGIPYHSLVSLGMADSPYSFAFDTHRSAGSIHDAHAHVHAPGSPRKSSAIPIGEPTAAQAAELARIDFEEREIATEATPLWRKPDAVIAGRPGLVRSLMLNDRQHVLTVDTEGEVAAWNILHGRCVGRFSAAEIAAALDLERGVEAGAAVRKHSSEVLELVKQRVEGETMVITWCQVDTKIGSLVVHLEEGRVYDAEVYADEVGVEVDVGPDTRLNLGKWALANLFRGVITAEEKLLLASPTSSAPGGAASSLSRSAGGNSLHISIERPQSPPHRQRALSTLSASPSINILGIATPALNPAVLPDFDGGSPGLAPGSPGPGHLSRSAPSGSGASWQTFNALRGSGNTGGGLGAIPGSPSGVGGRVNGAGAGYANGNGHALAAGGLLTGGTVATGGSTSPAPESSSFRGDYFSSRKRVDSSPARSGTAGGAGTGTGTDGAAPRTPKTPAATDERGREDRGKEGAAGGAGAGAGAGGGASAGAGASTPATPGLMGRFKGFGKKKEKETVMSVVKEDEVVVEAEKPAAPTRESEQLAILDAVRAQAFRPPPPWEAPPLALRPETQLLISEESKDAGAWVVTYRSQVRATQNDLEAVEGNAPAWLLDYLFTSRIKAKDPVKLTFILEPAPGCGLKEMPDGTSRLSASRILRARKVMAFIYDKLELGTSRGRTGSIVSIASRITAVPRKTSNAGAGATAVPIPGAAQGQGQGHNQGHRGSIGGGDEVHAEDTIELLCGDTVVDPLITLATLKQYYGSGGDMLLYYRPRKGVVVHK